MSDRSVGSRRDFRAHAKALIRGRSIREADVAASLVWTGFRSARCGSDNEKRWQVQEGPHNR